jgi:hypothetical protein
MKILITIILLLFSITLDQQSYLIITLEYVIIVIMRIETRSR